MIGSFSGLLVEIISQLRHPDYFNGFVFGGLCMSGLCYFLWLGLRVSKARRVLGYLPVINLKS